MSAEWGAVAAGAQAGASTAMGADRHRYQAQP